MCLQGMRDLTSTKDFTDLLFGQSLPMILKNDKNGRCLLDRCWEPAQTRSKIHKLYGPDRGGIVLSHNGLLVSRGGWGGPDFIIYNPVFRDVVNIIAKPLWGGDLYGVFFHPVHQEYCTLWRIVQPLTCQYKILNLESNPKWRDITNPPTQNRMLSDIPSISVDKYLYWMVDVSENHTGFSVINCDIRQFDIEKEEFRVMPCPASITVKRYYTYNVSLVDINGVVCVVEVIPSKELVKINIWTMKDDGEQLWKSCNYVINCDVCARFGVPKAVAFQDGELILVSDGRPYVCNLKLGTFRKLRRKYSYQAMFLSHVTSLVSLKKCKSDIYLEEDDEINHRYRDHGEDIQALS